ncbi:MAG: hypothetical protein V3T03_05075 [Candidatus Bipolaricaulota bacterium]
MAAYIKFATRKTVLIGIEPADVSFGEGLPPVVEAAACTLIELLRRNDLDEILQHESHLWSFSWPVLDFPLRGAVIRATRG